MKVDLTNKQTKEQKLNSKIAIPKERYTITCIKEEFTLSKESKQPMVVRTWEIVTDSVDMPDGSKLVVAGTEITTYYSLRSSGTKKSSPEKATAFLQDKFKEDTEKCAPDSGINWAEFDDEHPPLVMQGRTVDAILQDDPQKELKAPKPGQRQGDPILNDAGQPIIRHKPSINQYLGVSKTSVNAPY